MKNKRTYITNALLVQKSIYLFSCRMTPRLLLLDRPRTAPPAPRLTSHQTIRPLLHLVQRRRLSFLSIRQNP